MLRTHHQHSRFGLKPDMVAHTISPALEAGGGEERASLYNKQDHVPKIGDIIRLRPPPKKKTTFGSFS